MATLIERLRQWLTPTRVKVESVSVSPDVMDRSTAEAMNYEFCDCCGYCAQVSRVQQGFVTVRLCEPCRLGFCHKTTAG